MKKAVLMSIQPYWVFLIIAKKMGWDIRGRAREDCIGCWDCEITRPPQSWCYVEELG